MINIEKILLPGVKIEDLGKRKLDPDKIKESIAECRKQQKKALNRKKVNWDTLSLRITI